MNQKCMSHEGDKRIIKFCLLIKQNNKCGAAIKLNFSELRGKYGLGLRTAICVHVGFLLEYRLVYKVAIFPCLLRRVEILCGVT